MNTKQKLYISFVKRPMDMAGSLVAMVLMSPVVLLVTVVLSFANKGAGVFFVHERPGKDGKLFKLVKFKTMTDEYDEHGEMLPDDERLTRVGAFVRSTSLDELPQLVNILMGDMSFIGPRPLLVQYLPLYNDEQRHRHDVRPGLSGWAQVNGRNSISWQEKFRLDVEYVEQIGLLMDVRIFCMTVVNVLKRKDISSATCETMEIFKGNN